ncbi:U-scoloptoxin(01)-Er1a-like [Homarus americanus]|uniref:U-scoloptoxin(01)-Er1a-like n=1 Tax=Homarus americanus TaxID=6706 RepID=UPI001C458563|nr:U-scoloptoxin(01)-Er1a-like [Homarus americanus]
MIAFLCSVLRQPSLEQDPIAALAALIPGGGVPGEDYPILASVPDTGFSCEQQEFPGYFADTADEAGCQVFHICQFDGRQDSFLCPNGTIFNQQYFVCDWWFNVDCAASEQFRSLNAEIGKIPEDASSRSDVVAPSQLYGAPQQRQAPPPSQLYNSPNRS